MVSVEEQLGRRVAQHRKAAGLTQAELAERVDVTTETISRLERGAFVPRTSRLNDIANAMGVKLVDLFRFRDADSGKDRAIDRLVGIIARRKQEEIELVGDLAERLFRTK
jgi:transcriptional regulator with XRE-family HTH domain